MQLFSVPSSVIVYSLSLLTSDVFAMLMEIIHYTHITLLFQGLPTIRSCSVHRWAIGRPGASLFYTLAQFSKCTTVQKVCLV